MANLTLVGLDAAQAICSSFGLDIAAIAPFSGGSVNSNFRLTTRDDRTLFLRVYEEQGVDGARREAQLLDELGRCGIPVAQPLRDGRGEAIVLHVGKPVAVYPWIHGDIRCQRLVSVRDCEQLGAALAAVHLATSALSELPRGRFDVDELYARLDRVERDGTPELAEAGRAVRARLMRAANARQPNLPQGLIHGDLFRDNVLWNGASIAALLDFESASAGPFVYDLIVCIMAWCYADDFVPELVEALVTGYHSRRPLTALEVEAAASEAAIAALRFATTRITDFSMRAPEGQRPARDFRRFLARLDRVESGAITTQLARLRRSA
jgi:homoserine kinase type II